ncbi:hypothetical protein [Pedobacter xixiisoli]|uniref:Uncharacterized protein n=1 Tax=Pedobacter xixiisoli TaxID=1476464 RepID=A0A286ADD6_9SPHI|nr:hypothetical protein [Pedobacter xixiisoli]SOD19930.1 hypothetical protein SAMN06297358_3637 [Pedobacter xixiisoli]
MNLSLFKSCYKNYLNIDLEAIHFELNSYSEYHSINGSKLEIEHLNLINNPIKFTDESKEVFKLTNFEGKNFLISASRCYPCSRVYENIEGHRWVEILIVPDGKKIDLLKQNNSVNYSFYTLKLFDYLESFDDLITFDKLYVDTFSDNNWFSILERIQFLTRSKAKPKEILNAFIVLKLLNPFQISVLSIILNLEIKNSDIQNYLFNGNAIPLSIPYISNPTFKFKISDSTSKLIETTEFSDFVNSLSNEEINDFFELSYLEISLYKENIYPDLILDLLGIKILQRWRDAGSKDNVSENIKSRLISVNISKGLIDTYYKKLKNNLRSIENIIRSKKGFNVVGSLFNESLLYKQIKNIFPDYKVISQYSSDWLGRQRIDIFITELNIGIEYNGRQHYEPISFFGGEEGYLKTVARDEQKRLKCKEAGCELIEVKYDEDLQLFLETIKIKYKKAKSP